MSHAERYANRRPRITPRKFDNMRGNLQQLFTGTSQLGNVNEDESPISPKRSSGIPLQLPHLTQPRLAMPFIPHHRRAPTAASVSSLHIRGRSESPAARPMTPTAVNMVRNNISAPAPAQTSSLRSSRIFTGADEEAAMADMALRGRQLKSKKRVRSWSARLLPMIRSRTLRKKVLKTILVGSILIILLVVSLTETEGKEFHIFLVTSILATTIFFCHCLVTTCLCVARRRDNQYQPDATFTTFGPSRLDYADPVKPIHVVLASDEEARGELSEETKMPPPTYGQWRGSVRLDPNRLVWTRNESISAEDFEGTGRRGSLLRGAARNSSLLRRSTMSSTDDSDDEGAARRPPSYISEDGVDYVVEARPRITTYDVDRAVRDESPERGRSMV